MSASADDFFHKVGRSTATTLSAPGYTIGDTSINVASTTNWPTSTGVTFAIDETDADGNRISGTYNVFRGTVSGATQVNNLTYVGGDANRNYAAAATTRVYILVSAYRDNRFTDGVLVEHNQDGTHGAVTATSVTASGTVQGATVVATGDIQHRSVSLETIRSEIISNFVASGGFVAQSAGLVGTFSNMAHYINGVRCTKTSVPNKTYTASKDTYVDADATNNSTVTYTEVANGAASPSLTAGNIRVAKVVTNGSAITSVSQYGKENAVQIYPTDRTQGLFYQELARTTLTTTGTTITVSGITPRKYLRVLVFTPISSGTISHTMYFNNDTGNNYARRRAENGAADNTSNNNASIMASTAAVARWFTTADIINYASEEKMVHGFTSHNGGNGAANYPTRIEFAGKWANTTDAITRIDVANGGTGNFGAGSEVVVLGHD